MDRDLHHVEVICLKFVVIAGYLLQHRYLGEVLWLNVGCDTGNIKGDLEYKFYCRYNHGTRGSS